MVAPACPPLPRLCPLPVPQQPGLPDTADSRGSGAVGLLGPHPGDPLPGEAMFPAWLLGCLATPPTLLWWRGCRRCRFHPAPTPGAFLRAKRAANRENAHEPGQAPGVTPARPPAGVPARHRNWDRVKGSVRREPDTRGAPKPARAARQEEHSRSSLYSPACRVPGESDPAAPVSAALPEPMGPGGGSAATPALV